MGKITGFKEYERQEPTYEDPKARVKHWKDFQTWPKKEEVEIQGARCMDCGVPFCHTGCPLGNLIPDWNDLVYQKRWKEAYISLASTNNFPEFTGKICPAPCEDACVLAINKPAVAIKTVEFAIVEMAWKEGWISPKPPEVRSGKKIAVIGSGPAGLAAADQLNKAGHLVTVYEKDDRLGGLLTYGIPDFKMEKNLIERRVELMKAEGITFVTNAHVGKNVSGLQIRQENDAVILAVGSIVPREMALAGREAKGIYFAMDYLTQNNKAVKGDQIKSEELISAKGKHVVVIGAGDTGSDCIGTANRQGAASVRQIYYKPIPPNERTENDPWPSVPNIFRTTSSQEEGVEREWSFMSKEFIKGKSGNVEAIRCVKVEWDHPVKGKSTGYREVPGSDFTFKADLVLIALGYLHPEPKGLLEELGIERDGRGNIKTDHKYLSSAEGIFAAGDGRIGQSLVVNAISEGRECAREVDSFLRGAASHLNAKNLTLLDHYA